MLYVPYNKEYNTIIVLQILCLLPEVRPSFWREVWVMLTVIITIVAIILPIAEEVCECTGQ